MVEVVAEVVVDGIGRSITEVTVTGTAVVVVEVVVLVVLVVLVVAVTSSPETGEAPIWDEHPVRRMARKAALMSAGRGLGLPGVA